MSAAVANAPASLVQVHTHAGYRFLYCHACRSVVFQAGLLRHLRRLHTALSHKQRLRIIAQSAALADLITQPDHATRPLPPDRSLPIPYLPAHRGFACGWHGCRFLSRNRDCVRKHLNADHALHRGAWAPYIQRVTLQSWYSDTRATYWIVDAGGRKGGESERESHMEGGRRGGGQLDALELEALQAQEQERLDQRRQDHRAGGTTLQATELTLWLRHTQWPVQFANQPLDILAATSALPRKPCAADYLLGAWEGTDFLSPAEDELKLRQLLRLLGRVFDRCLRTLQATPEPLRCWLKSYAETTFCPRPFTALERQASQRRYISYWSRFLCFVFRAWRTELPLRSRIYGIQFSVAQEVLMTHIWTLLSKDVVGGLDNDLGDDLDDDPDDDLGDDLGDDSGDDSDDDSDDDPDDDLEEGLAESGHSSDLESQRSGSDDGSPDDDCLVEGPAEGPSEALDLGSDVELELAEQLLQLSCAFWTDLSGTGETLHLPVVCFAGVLGIQREGLTYRPAHLYTTYAAGLVWVGRLLMLEYALPRQAYRTLSWPSCAACPNQLQRLQLIRRKYLCKGGLHAMAHILELLYQGRTIAKREGRRANLSWSPDGQVLQIDGAGTFSMVQFRTMAWLTIQDCQKLLRELMFHWQPAVDLDAIQDNLTNIQAGWSFLEEPANGLQGSFRHLHRRAWHGIGCQGLMAKGQWSHARSGKYLRMVASFQRLLLACIHFTGGIPARGTEVTTIKWCNTRHVMRNIFVYQGRLVVITEYTKARGRMNKSFYIVRFLPLLVSQILFQYLVYVRPFVEALSSQAQLRLGSQGAASLDQYSFAFTRTDDDRPFHTNDLSAIISKQTKKVLGTPLATASYRQATLAIAKQHIATIARPLDPYSARTGSNALLLGIAHQAGHTIQTLMDSYAINKAYPTRLQPELIYQYKMVSELWHQWLRLGELGEKLAAKRLREDARASLDREAATLPLPLPLPTRRPKGRPRKQPGVQPGQVAGQVSGLLPGPLPDQTPNRLLNRLPDPMPGQLPSRLQDRPLNQTLDQTLDPMPDQLRDQTLDQTPDQLPDPMLDQLPDPVPDQLPGQLPDQTPDQMPGRLLHQTLGQLLGRLRDQTLDPMPEQMSDPMPDQTPSPLLDHTPSQLPRLKRTVAEPAQAGRPTKRQARDRSATILPFTPPPTSPFPVPTYETKVRVDLTLLATPTAQATGKGRQVDLIDLVDLTGSPTPTGERRQVDLIDLTGSPTPISPTTSPTLTRSPLRPLSSSAINKGLGELQALLNENPWT